MELPFSLTRYTAVIYDAKHKPIFKIIGSRFQKQICLTALPCGECLTSMFTIIDGLSGSEKALGRIVRRWSNCMKMCCAQASWYIIDFPKECDWK